MATLHKKRIQKTEMLLNRDAPGFFSLYAPKAPSKCYRRRRRLAHGAPMMYTVCPKKTQSQSDYLQARSAYYAPKAPVVGAEGAWCRGKKHSREATILKARSAII